MIARRLARPMRARGPLCTHHRCDLSASSVAVASVRSPHETSSTARTLAYAVNARDVPRRSASRVMSPGSRCGTGTRSTQNAYHLAHMITIARPFMSTPLRRHRPFGHRHRRHAHRRQARVGRPGDRLYAVLQRARRRVDSSPGQARHPGRAASRATRTLCARTRMEGLGLPLDWLGVGDKLVAFRRASRAVRRAARAHCLRRRWEGRRADFQLVGFPMRGGRRS